MLYLLCSVVLVVLKACKVLNVSHPLRLRFSRAFHCSIYANYDYYQLPNQLALTAAYVPWALTTLIGSSLHNTCYANFIIALLGQKGQL